MDSEADIMSPAGLTDNEEQLVADLLADLSEGLQDGHAIPIEEYLERLPNEATRRAFQRVAVMTHIIETVPALRTRSARI